MATEDWELGASTLVNSNTGTNVSLLSKPLDGVPRLILLSEMTFLDPDINWDNVSISSTFCPGALLPRTTDTILHTSDSVLFYVNSNVVASAQPNAFRGLMGVPLTDSACRDRIIKINESSNILAIMLHSLYNMPCTTIPPFDSIVTAVDRLPLYEINPATHLTTGSYLYNLILYFAPIKPIEVYALAGFHRLNTIAVEASSHLIHYPLSSITDELANRIGSFYLLRLFRWRFHRASKLKQILVKPLFPHPPTQKCSLKQQRASTQLWADVSAKLGSEYLTDLTLSSLKSLVDPRLDDLECQMCKEVIEKMMMEVIIEWNTVPRTIGPV